ncbi:MAG: 50S ribosomal protein L25, partial [Candidatus Latescibacteria bacterium]|nr:50S ribosomal protein L25 [Candidatus Latescibacterota bacterium]
MSGNVVLKAEPRPGRGKEAAKHLRKQGDLPAVVYGEDSASVVCSVNRKALEDILHAEGRNAIVSLVVGNDEGDEQTTIIKELQRHPFRGGILHVDFQRISLTQKITVEVAVAALGIPVGVRQDGGVLEHMLHSMEIECLPTQIPDKIEVDVSALVIGDTVHVEDITVDEGLRIVTEGDRSVFVVVPPTVVQEPEEEEEE